jgi:hypothetical protein
MSVPGMTPTALLTVAVTIPPTKHNPSATFHQVVLLSTLVACSGISSNAQAYDYAGVPTTLPRKLRRSLPPKYHSPNCCYSSAVERTESL